MHKFLSLGFVLFLVSLAPAAESTVPQSVEAISVGYDPRKEPLDVKVVREWEREGIVYRYVTFHVATFKGRPARLAAFYGFPQGAKNLPGLLHLHGGGQRAFLHEVEFFAKRGYACLSINWGGREMEEAQPGDPNTDWGAVDATQRNTRGSWNLQPGEEYPDAVESPRNNSWYLRAVAARRGLTFLERQAEVDGDRLGVYGLSMGGVIAVHVAGTDDRVKVAVPSVGGQGFRTYPWPLLPERRKVSPIGDLELFRATIESESYAPRIRAPLLWLSATNDFNCVMDDAYRTGALIPHEKVRYAFAPHLSHRLTPEFAVTRSLWLDQYLKGDFQFPATPESKLRLSTDDGVPMFEVRPDGSMPIDRVEIFYSLDPNPQARFWRSSEATRTGGAWMAPLPIVSNDQPLFAFANVYYRLDRPQPVPSAQPTETFAISSLLHTATPEALRAADAKATDEPSLLIDDFSRGWQDWYVLSGNQRNHWEYSTRKLNDPKWRGREGFHLAFDVQADKPNELVVILTENFFRPYRGETKPFVAVVKLNGGAEAQTVVLTPHDFKALNGDALSSWKHVDILSFRAFYEAKDRTFGGKQWSGPQPKFQSLRWVEQ